MQVPVFSPVENMYRQAPLAPWCWSRARAERMQLSVRARSAATWEGVSTPETHTCRRRARVARVRPEQMQQICVARVYWID